MKKLDGNFDPIIFLKFQIVFSLAYEYIHYRNKDILFSYLLPSKIPKI